MQNFDEAAPVFGSPPDVYAPYFWEAQPFGTGTTCSTTFALPEVRLCLEGTTHIFGATLDAAPGDTVP